LKVAISTADRGVRIALHLLNVWQMRALSASLSGDEKKRYHTVDAGGD